MYLLRLETNYSSEPILVPEEYIVRCDSYRENSLFSPYTLSQKGFTAYVSQNIFQFNQIMNGR